jgi:hypothetical protein
MAARLVRGPCWILLIVFWTDSMVTWLQSSSKIEQGRKLISMDLVPHCFMLCLDAPLHLSHRQVLSNCFPSQISPFSPTCSLPSFASLWCCSFLWQKRLKVVFRDLVNVTPHLGDIIEQLLEPAPEDRFQVTQVLFFSTVGTGVICCSTGHTVSLCFAYTVSRRGNKCSQRRRKYMDAVQCITKISWQCLATENSSTACRDRSGE